MIGWQFAQRQIAKLSFLPGYPCNDTLALGEMRTALEEVENEAQAQAVITELIQQPGRRFCPMPGEIQEAIVGDGSRHIPTADTSEYEAPPEPNCKDCGDSGCIDVSDGLINWCTCAAGIQRRSSDPEYVGVFNSSMDRFNHRTPKRIGLARRKPGEVAKFLAEGANLSGEPKLKGGKLTKAKDIIKSHSREPCS